jgi:transcriptional regulator with XRE-family HTH domain
LSQEQLAHDAGLRRTVVGAMERDERDFGVSKLWSLAEALNVSVTELFR